MMPMTERSYFKARQRMQLGSGQRHKPRPAPPGNLERDIRESPHFAANREALFADVAQLIRVAIQKRGLTQSKLAYAMGQSSYRTVARAVAGSDNKLSTIADIATALGKRIKMTLEDE